MTARYDGKPGRRAALWTEWAAAQPVPAWRRDTESPPCERDNDQPEEDKQR